MKARSTPSGHPRLVLIAAHRVTGSQPHTGTRPLSLTEILERAIRCKTVSEPRSLRTPTGKFQSWVGANRRRRRTRVHLLGWPSVHLCVRLPASSSTAVPSRGAVTSICPEAFYSSCESGNAAGDLARLKCQGLHASNVYTEQHVTGIFAPASKLLPFVGSKRWSRPQF